MLNFIVLTSIDGDKKYYINPNQICTFYTYDDGSIVQFSDTANYRRVKESSEEIKEMIDNISNTEMGEY